MQVKEIKLNTWHLRFMVFAQNPSDSIYQTCYQRYTGCSPVTHLIHERRLRFFRHVTPWHVLTFSSITIGLLRRRSDRPVIGGDLSDAHVPSGQTWVDASSRVKSICTF